MLDEYEDVEEEFDDEDDEEEEDVDIIKLVMFAKSIRVKGNKVIFK
jgi:hypothetical protein